MKLKYLYALIIFSINICAQNKSQESKIYDAIDAFIANPKQENLKILSKTEINFFKSKLPKTQANYLAIVILNCNRGFFENQFSLSQNAISSYENAWKLFTNNCSKVTLEQFDVIENCLVPLGKLYTIIGDYDNAENIIKQYYNLAFRNKKINQTHLAISNLAVVYQQTGRVDLAIDLLNETLISNQLSTSEKALFKSNLGANYLLVNENIKAEKEINDAIKIFENLENQNTNLSNCYKNLSEIYFQKKDFKKAKDCFEKVLQIQKLNAPVNKFSEAQNLYQYAFLLHKINENNQSEKLLNLSLSNLIIGFNPANNALPNQKKLFANNVLLDVLDLKAAIYSIENKPNLALKAYGLSFYIEDLFSNLLFYQNSKIINQIRTRNRTEKCIAVYEKLFQIEKKQSYLEAAFLLSDQSKSSVLRDAIIRKKDFSADEKKLQNDLQNINNAIIKEQQKLNYANINKINDLIKQQNQSMLLLKSKQKTNLKIVDQKLNLQLLFEKLNKDNAILEAYFVGQNIIYSFALSDNKIVLNRIDYSESNKNLIVNFIDLFASPDSISNDILRYNLVANSLYQMLKLPIKTSKNLIIIPDGLLNFVPFEALITKKSVTSNFAKMNYFLNDFAIGYSNSARFYLGSAKISNKNSVLGIFPVFEKTDFELAFSKTEMKAIKSEFKGKYFENSSANFANFRTNANQFSILHLSTHADSGDLENPATIKFFDKTILYSELYELDINPDLVVLSACQTGVGKLYKSEGAMSVARGFQYAGAKNLLFSLWKVNDFTTSVLMTNFYKNLKNKMSFFDANNQSKKDFLNDKSISNAKKSPYYWSAFVYYGTLEQPSNNYWVWILGAVFGLLLSWFLVKK